MVLSLTSVCLLNLVRCSKHRLLLASIGAMHVLLKWRLLCAVMRCPSNT